jgi:dihydroneopterin aldolase
MLGTVGIENLKIVSLIGVREKERISMQELYIDLRMRYDFSRCVEKDSLEAAVDYSTVAKICEEIAQKGAFHLIETLAVGIIENLMQNFPIQAAWIRIKKPEALAKAEYAFVEFERDICTGP